MKHASRLFVTSLQVVCFVLVVAAITTVTAIETRTAMLVVLMSLVYLKGRRIHHKYDTWTLPSGKDITEGRRLCTFAGYEVHLLTVEKRMEDQ